MSATDHAATDTQMQAHPGKELLKRVRAGFVLLGLSLGKWCHDNGVHRQNAHACLLGKWNGPKARDLRARIVREAGVSRGAR